MGAKHEPEPGSSQHLREPGHIHTHRYLLLVFLVGSRVYFSHKVSLEQGNPSRPVRGGGYAGGSKPSCRPASRPEAVDPASSLSWLRRLLFCPPTWGGLTHSVISLSHIIAQLRLTLSSPCREGC